MKNVAMAVTKFTIENSGMAISRIPSTKRNMASHSHLNEQKRIVHTRTDRRSVHWDGAESSFAWCGWKKTNFCRVQVGHITADSDGTMTILAPTQGRSAEAFHF